MISPRTTFPLVVFVASSAVAVGQVQPRRATPSGAIQSAPRPEHVVLNAIRSHPLTAAYPIAVTWRQGVVVLSGAVGTKQVHDTAVRLAIGTGVPFRDDLVVDTGMAHMVARTAPALSGGLGRPLTSQSSAVPYVYPQPLFGWLDDPFFGFEPPLVSFPPWWSRGAQTGPMVPPRRAPGAGAAAAGAAPSQGWRALDVDPVKGQVDISVDMAGQVFLRGAVVSEEVAREIVAAARSVPGVTGVYSQLQVIPRRAPAENENPPPPPVPIEGRAERDGPIPIRETPVPAPPVIARRSRPVPAVAVAPAALDSQALTRRVVGSLERRPLTAKLPVNVRSADGVVTLGGQVPTTYEAMFVYRAAQQTPGVHDIIDRLEFTVPDEDHPNPLVHKGRPEDVEPYLAAQIRRHVGDLAHIDRIQARGDLLELHGTIENATDQERLMAILRSIPILHGFRLETQFRAD